MISPIYIALMLLDALVLWALIGARGKWPVKVAAIVVVLGFNFVVWSAMSSFRGWPTTDTPPSRSVFVQGIVNEPDVQSHDRGAIYLWLIPLSKPGNPLGYQSKGQEPRAYRLPYSEELYKQVLQAQKRQKSSHGQPVVVQRVKARPNGRSGSGQPTPRFDMKSYVLPPTTPPSKAGDNTP